MIRLLILTMLFTSPQSSEKRVITVYAQSAQNPQYLQQMHWLDADKAGLQERDIIIKTYLYNKQTADLFKTKGLKAHFTVTLTGKDGGEKYRATEPISLQKLYSLVDAMPMRKAEMKSRE